MLIPPRTFLILLLWFIPFLTSVSSLAASSPTQWALPLSGVSPRTIIAAFTPPTSPFGSGHRGVDFPARQGQQVSAVGSGIVVFAGSIAGKPVVSIELSHGIDGSAIPVRSTYEPVTSLVNAGDFVEIGTVIGFIDFEGTNAGHCQGTCLHFGLKVMAEPNAHYLNPENLWRSTAMLQPSSVGYLSPIGDAQFQMSSAAFQH